MGEHPGNVETAAYVMLAKPVVVRGQIAPNYRSLVMTGKPENPPISDRVAPLVVSMVGGVFIWTVALARSTRWMVL